MLFALTCIDKPDSEALRLANRDAHLAYWGETGKVKLGGPFTDDAGEHMEGSFLVIDVADRAEAEHLQAEDPYQTAGLFARVDIRAWKWLLGN
ncbi:YciI family protein [Pyruvatibacter sp. HU-CL02332]|uniref:YciI family protein n=1 Tax=Pyruvatibacter sp. HU-CL02332 TaxID=3127650 RepID=UPI002967BA3C|nr:YciI family protein [Alphaproteobacteria bacterium]